MFPFQWANSFLWFDPKRVCGRANNLCNHQRSITPQSWSKQSWNEWLRKEKIEKGTILSIKKDKTGLSKQQRDKTERQIERLKNSRKRQTDKTG